MAHRSEGGGSMKYFIFIFLLVFNFTNIFCIGHVILLDGASSSGKTSIGKSLKGMLGDDWRFVYKDIFDWNLIAQWAENTYGCKLPRNDIEEIEKQLKSFGIDVGKLAENFNEKIGLICKSDSDLYDEVKRLVNSGKNVICENVVWSQASWNKCFQNLGDEVISVLIYCPFDMNEERIEARNMRESVVEYRSLSLFLEHFRLLFKPEEQEHENVLGEIILDDFDEAFELSKDDFNKNTGVKKFYSVPIDKSDLIQDLGLKDNKSSFLSSKFHHDLTINTSFGIPEKCAQKIKDYVFHNIINV